MSYRRLAVVAVLALYCMTASIKASDYSNFWREPDYRYTRSDIDDLRHECENARWEVQRAHYETGKAQSALQALEQSLERRILRMVACALLGYVSSTIFSESKSKLIERQIEEYPHERYTKTITYQPYECRYDIPFQAEITQPSKYDVQVKKHHGAFVGLLYGLFFGAFNNQDEFEKVTGIRIRHDQIFSEWWFRYYMIIGSSALTSLFWPIFTQRTEATEAGKDLKNLNDVERRIGYLTELYKRKNDKAQNTQHTLQTVQANLEELKGTNAS